MSENKHTPGPWVIREPNGKGHGYLIRESEAWFGHRAWSEETRANATLCAAAPDLLDALEAAISAMRRVPYPAPHVIDAIIKRGDKAIAKALGK